MALILVADDSGYMRMKIRGMLKTGGHETLEADSGGQALQMALTHKPDCILLDLIMPDMHGLKVLSSLEGLGLGIPVIVLTADIQESVREQCLSLGAKAFINKPPRDEELRDIVTRVLGLRQGAP